jgi:hypothetical protein
MVVVVLCAIGISGCAPGDIRDPKGDIIYDRDQVIPGRDGKPTGLRITDFRWEYHAWIDQLQINGVVENTGAQPLEGYRLKAFVFDQFGTQLGYNESYLAPSYIPPQGNATFDFYVNHGRWVKNIAIRYHFDSRY